MSFELTEYGKDRLSIGGATISKVGVADALRDIDIRIENGKHGYICFMDARAAYMANEDKEYSEIQNKSLITFADGLPLSWIASNYGYEIKRVTAVDFMDLIFSISFEKGYSHYFYGGSKDVIDEMKKKLNEKYPNISILASIAPPYQPVELFDVEKIVNDLNELKPTFFWCSLGAPKQEILISNLQPKLKYTFCVGVGLAFNYIAGEVTRAPLFVRSIGLEWMYRLIQQPYNIKRVFRPFLWIMKKVFLSAINKYFLLFGIKRIQ